MTLHNDPFTRADEDAALEGAISDIVTRLGCLPSAEAERLARGFGCSTRTIYRRARRMVAAPDETPGHASDQTPGTQQDPPTFLDLLAAGEGFYPDDLFWTLHYFCGGNMVRTKSEVERLGLAMPSLPTLSRIKRQLPPLVQDGARHGLTNRNRHVLHVRHSASRPNEAWQVDELTFDIEVLDPCVRQGRPTTTGAGGAKPKTIRPRLVVFVDDYSRFITGWCVLEGATNSDEFLCTMAAGIELRPAEDTSGIMIGGAPDTLVFDNAQAFRSFLVADCLTGLPIHAVPTPAYTPTAKGKVERVIQTIQEWVVTGLPGVCSNAARLDGSDLLGLDAGYFLEFETFVAIVSKVIHDYNYEHLHSEIGCAPIARYRTSGAAARTMTDAALAELWLPVHRDNGRRQVHSTGIKVTFGETYWYQAPELSMLLGKKVHVRALHHRSDRVAVFAGDDRRGFGDFVGIATRSSTLTAEDCSKIAATGIEQSKTVTERHRKVRRGLEQRSADIATGTDRGALAAITVSMARQATEGTFPADGEPQADVEPAVGATSDEPAKATRQRDARRPGRRPTTRRAARTTRKSPAVPAPTRGGAAKDAALVAVAQEAMARRDADSGGGQRPTTQQLSKLGKPRDPQKARKPNASETAGESR